MVLGWPTSLSDNFLHTFNTVFALVVHEQRDLEVLAI